jgi:hypothetical protein
LNKNLKGFEEINILRRLRRIFVHTTGRYNPKDTEEKKLYYRIVDHFNLQPPIADPNNATEYPLRINQVLMKITDGCIKYVEEFTSL